KKKVSPTFRQVKEKLPSLQNPGVCCIPCICGKVYIDKTRRTVEERIRKLIRNNNKCSNNIEMSATALHSAETEHADLFDQSTLLAGEKIKEEINIQGEPNNLNENWTNETGQSMVALDPFLQQL
ncbi:hypothetical protein C0J52_23603, partial [Blattella germanica]